MRHGRTVLQGADYFELLEPDEEEVEEATGNAGATMDRSGQGMLLRVYLALHSQCQPVVCQRHLRPASLHLADAIQTDNYFSWSQLRALCMLPDSGAVPLAQEMQQPT